MTRIKKISVYISIAIFSFFQFIDRSEAVDWIPEIPIGYLPGRVANDINSGSDPDVSAYIEPGRDLVKVYQQEGMTIDLNSNFDAKSFYDIYKYNRYYFYQYLDQSLPKILPKISSVDQLIDIYKNIYSLIRDDFTYDALKMAQNMPSESVNVEKEVSKQFNQDDVEKLVTHILSRQNTHFEGRNALQTAILYKNFKLYESILEYMDGRSLLTSEDYQGEHALDYLFKSESYDLIEELYERYTIYFRSHSRDLFKKDHNETYAKLFSTRSQLAFRIFNCLKETHFSDVDKHELTYFHYLVRYGAQTGLEKYIKKYLDVFAKYSWEGQILGRKNAIHQNSLLQTVMSGQNETAMALIDVLRHHKIAIENIEDHQKNTLLHYAAMKSDIRVFSAIFDLMKKDSDFSTPRALSATNSNGNSVIDEAVISGNMEVYTFLMAKFVNTPRYFTSDSFSHLIDVVIKSRNVMALNEVISQASKLGQNLGSFKIQGKFLADYAFTLGYHDIYRVLKNHQFTSDLDSTKEEIDSRILRSYISSRKLVESTKFLSSNTFLCKYLSAADHMNVLMYSLSTASDPRIIWSIFNTCLKNTSDPANEFLDQIDGSGNNLLHLAFRSQKTDFVESLYQTIFTEKRDESLISEKRSGQLLVKLINARNSEGESPVKILADSRNVELIKGASAYLKHYRYNPLSYPLQNKDAVTLSHFLKYYQSIGRKGSDGKRPIETVVANNDIDSFFVLMKRNLSTNLKKYDHLMHLAASNNSDKLIRPLLEFGLEVDKVNEKGENPVLVAVRHGAFEAMEELCRIGADFHLKDETETSAFEFSRNKQELRKFYRAMNNLVEDKNICIRGNCILLDQSSIESWKIALVKKDFRKIKIFLKSYPLIYRLPIDTPEGHFEHSLHYLMSLSDSGYFPNFVKLIDDFDINEQFDGGNTLLHQAVLMGTLKPLESYLKNGDVDFSIENDLGITAFILAFNSGKTQVMDEFRSFADASILDQLSADIFERAITSKADSRLFSCFYSLHAQSQNQINQKNEYNQTLLMIAAKNGAEQVVADLLDAGAKVSLQDGDNKNALMHALENGHSGIAIEIAKRMKWVEISCSKDADQNSGIEYAIRFHSGDFIAYLYRNYRQDLSSYLKSVFGHDQLTGLGYAVKYRFEKIIPFMIGHMSISSVGDRGQKSTDLALSSGLQTKTYMKLLEQLNDQECSVVTIYKESVSAKAFDVAGSVFDPGVIDSYEDLIEILELAIHSDRPDDVSKALKLLETFSGYQWRHVEDAFYKITSPEIATLFLEFGMDLNARARKSGDTLLLKAAKRRNVDLAEMLLEQRADLFVQNRTGKMPVDYMIKNKKMHKIINRALSYGHYSLSSSALNSIGKRWNVSEDSMMQFNLSSEASDLAFEIEHKFPKEYILDIIDEMTVDGKSSAGINCVSLSLFHPDGLKIADEILKVDQRLLAEVDRDGLDATARVIRDISDFEKVEQFLKLFIGTYGADLKKTYEVGPEKVKHSLLTLAMDSGDLELVEKLKQDLENEREIISAAISHGKKNGYIKMLKILSGGESRYAW